MDEWNDKACILDQELGELRQSKCYICDGYGAVRTNDDDYERQCPDCYGTGEAH